MWWGECCFEILFLHQFHLFHKNQLWKIWCSFYHSANKLCLSPINCCLREPCEGAVEGRRLNQLPLRLMMWHLAPAWARVSVSLSHFQKSSIILKVPWLPGSTCTGESLLPSLHESKCWTQIFPPFDAEEGVACDRIYQKPRNILKESKKEFWGSSPKTLNQMFVIPFVKSHLRWTCVSDFFELLCILLLLTKGGSSLLICIEINSAPIILTIKSAEPSCVYSDSDKSLKLYAVRADLAFSFQSPPTILRINLKEDGGGVNCN